MGQTEKQRIFERMAAGAVSAIMMAVTAAAVVVLAVMWAAVKLIEFILGG